MDLFVARNDKSKNKNFGNSMSNQDLIGSINSNVLNSKLENPQFNGQKSLLRNSIDKNLDFPTYVPWQNLSTEINENLKSSAIRNNKR